MVSEFEMQPIADATSGRPFVGIFELIGIDVVARDLPSGQRRQVVRDSTATTPLLADVRPMPAGSPDASRCSVGSACPPRRVGVRDALRP